MLQGIALHCHVCEQGQQFEHVDAAVRKFSGYCLPPSEEAEVPVQELIGQWETLRQMRDDMVDIARSSATELCAASDLRDIDGKLPELEQFGEALEADRVALRSRRAVLAEAIASEMNAATAGSAEQQDHEVIDAVQAVLLKYKPEEWPRDVLDMPLKRLRLALGNATRNIARGLRSVAQGDDVLAVDAALTKYADCRRSLSYQDHRMPVEAAYNSYQC